MKNLKNASKSHYGNKTLSDEQLTNLLALQRQDLGDNTVVDSEDRKPQPGYVVVRSRTVSLLAMAASLLVALGAFWLYQSNSVDIRMKIAEEIAYNHAKQMALEVVTADLDAIRSRLSELDFRLVRSDRIAGPDWSLLGGRYCSIQGQLAAQLRVASRSGSAPYTYYQALIPDEFELEDGGYSTWVDGTHVKLWIEDGVLLGLAGEKHAP